MFTSQHISQTYFLAANSLNEVTCSDFNGVSARLPCYLLKNPLKLDFWDIYVTTYFEVHKFKNTSAMRVIFTSFKIKCKFPQRKKKRRKSFRLWDNCISICCYKLSLLRREYLSSAVNVLTNSPKILHITMRDFFQLKCLYSDQ